MGTGDLHVYINTYLHKYIKLEPPPVSTSRVQISKATRKMWTKSKQIRYYTHKNLIGSYSNQKFVLVGGLVFIFGPKLQFKISTRLKLNQPTDNFLVSTALKIHLAKNNAFSTLIYW